MTEAWMKRSSERQEFMEKLYRQVFDEEGESLHEKHAFYTGFIIAILQWLGERKKFPLPYRDTPAYLLWHTIRPQIRDFARTPEEETFLITDLLLKSTISLTSFARQVLSAQETFQGELLFEGRRAMDDF